MLDKRVSSAKGTERKEATLTSSNRRSKEPAEVRVITLAEAEMKSRTRIIRRRS